MQIKNYYRKIKEKKQHLAHLLGQLENFRYNQKKLILENKILHSVEKGISSQKYCEREIIVSLTSYGRRLQDVCFTIESIMQQTMLPNRIILNLDASCHNTKLPLALQKQMHRGLEIRIIDDDIKSYKKLLPTMKDYPEAVIITVDDDLLYDFDIIERLYNSYVEKPTMIHALRTHVIQVNKYGKPLNYLKWKWGTSESENSNRVFATGVGGILYPPRCFSEEVFNQDVFKNICPSADDVWFHAMALINGKKVVKVSARNRYGDDYILNEDVQDLGLRNLNYGNEQQNDVQIKAVYEKYGIYDLLK